MSSYMDAGTQTVWAGLMQQSVGPETLFTAPVNTSTPPAEIVTDKHQLPGAPEITHSHHGDEQPTHPSSLVERRQGRPGLVARISIPNPHLNDDVPLSPPPTHAILSPLPEANTRHAGHTPLIPRARSPADEKVEAAVVPEPQIPSEEGNLQEVLDEDPELTGSLVLPEKPEDALESHNFSLDALTTKLVKIERQQKILRGEFSDDEDAGLAPSSPQQTAPPQSLSHPTLSQHAPSLQSPPGLAPAAAAESLENGLPLSRKESGDSRKSGATEEVDGVILKTPPSNFGTPFGQL